MKQLTCNSQQNTLYIILVFSLKKSGAMQSYILNLLVLICSISIASGSFESQVKSALLKTKLVNAIDHSACGASLTGTERERLNRFKSGSKLILMKASPKLREAYLPNQEVIGAAANIYCSKKSLELAMKELRGGHVSVSLNTIDTSDDFDSNTDGTASIDSDEDEPSNLYASPAFWHHSSSISTFPLFSFVAGICIGSVLSHYFLLVKNTSAPSKVLRRPEL